MNQRREWMEMNNRHWGLMVKWIRLGLQTLADAREQQEENRSRRQETENVLEQIFELEKRQPAPALKLLAENLKLSLFDQRILALCAVMELDPAIPDLCARAQGNPNKTYPTFALALALFDEPEWISLTPQAPLRYWRLLEINQPGSRTLTAATLAADERIINYLKGLNYLDDRLELLVDPVHGPAVDGPLPPSQQKAVDSIIEALRSAHSVDKIPAIELLGRDSSSKRLIAASAASSLGLILKTMTLEALPKPPGDFESFARLWQRESLLTPLALLIDVNDGDEAGKTRLKRFLEGQNGIVFLDNRDSKVEVSPSPLSLEIDKPTPEEQENVWAETLQGKAEGLAGRLAEQFSFGTGEIQRIAQAALQKEFADEEALEEELWQTCRKAARVGMEQLARRIDVRADWDQLVLPPEQKSQLRQITDQVGQRNRVYDDWGFRKRMNRGLGINALFAGESGTGKTMAAEVIAQSLQLDLYRIDLSTVVSKYIGETEKNLRKLFDAAEDSGAILFCDEADALFGKRSEVKDSHDRYANIEVNYLLQRMETYTGLAILATNMKNSLDKAFVRRLRFIVDFPFPEFKERLEIWRTAFPSDTPVEEGLDYSPVARLSLTGGSIHNIALNAAFLAAQDGGRVTLPLLLQAARSEFKKLERPSKETDFQWPRPMGGAA